MKKLFRSMVILSALLTACLAFGQEPTLSLPQDRAAQYYLGSKDELLIPINVWGFVQKPGQYLIPDNTDLITLLSYAGGPTENAKISHIRVIRNDRKVGNVVYKVDVKKFIETGDNRLIPILKPGDTIIVSGTTFHWINQFFEFVSRLAIIAQIYYLIVISNSYNNK
jgi:polysaccharide biosynthesis/export protein